MLFSLFPAVQRFIISDNIFNFAIYVIINSSFGEMLELFNEVRDFRMHLSAVDTLKPSQAEHIHIAIGIFDFAFSTVSDFDGGIARRAKRDFKIAYHIAPFLCLVIE